MVFSRPFLDGLLHLSVNSQACIAIINVVLRCVTLCYRFFVPLVPYSKSIYAYSHVRELLSCCIYGLF